MNYSQADLKDESRIRRLNLINSITGIKPANLIGTVSASGTPNLAIFSSILHLGSNPALIGFILRPHGEFRRDTFLNLQETGICTVNSVQAEFAENAHYTSAKFESSESEFEKVGLSEEYFKDCPAPFVAESRLKYSLKLEQTIPIELNGTTLVIGSVQDLYVDDEAVSPEGYINFETLDLVGVGGLNSYYQLSQSIELPYARVTTLPDFKKRATSTNANVVP